MSAPQKTKLFVGRLPEGCSSKDLEELFGQCGQVSECDVVGKFGFVHMSTQEEADECIKKLNKYAFMGSQLSVELSTSRMHLEPGTSGRARGPMKSTKRPYNDRGRGYYSDSSRDEPYGSEHKQYQPPSSDGYPYSSYSEGRYNGHSNYGQEQSYYNRDRTRTYPYPYERRSCNQYDEPYMRRPYPPPNNDPHLGAPPAPPHGNIYARRPVGDNYDSHLDVSTPMYSTRSPPPQPSVLSSPPGPSRPPYWDYHSQQNGHYNQRNRMSGDALPAGPSPSRRPPY